jgi:hypothetical protein
MKQYIKYTLIFVVSLILFACSEDFLDLTPQDRLTADDYYKNEDEIRAATALLYGFPWFGFDDKFSWLAGDCMSGNIYYTYEQEGQFFYFSYNEGNSHLSGGWTGLFRVVSYANSVINDMPRIAADNGISQDIIDQALGEARFIRAAAYYILTEYWGEVSIVENSTKLVSENNTILPKNTQASLYEFIRRDLEFAEENLNISDDPGRVTQWSAKGMLAKLYVTMAQHYLNSDATLSDSCFVSAEQYANDVITNSGLSLMDDYADLFFIENNNNEESLFALQWMKGGYALGNSRNVNWARSTIIADDQWGGGKGMTYDFQECIEDSDERQTTIYMTLGNYYPELNVANGGYTYNFETENPENSDSPLESPNEVLNHLKKFVVGSSDDTNGQVGTDQDAAINQYILRLADVYLILAEAILGSGTSTANSNALWAINEIRHRADLEELSSITFLDILKERRIELALESMYWFDLKRYYYRSPQEAIDYINTQKRGYTYSPISGTDDEPNSWDSYQLNAPEDSIILHESQMYLPIPASEVLKNPLLSEDAEEYEFD